jgi:hypothetical protein
MTEPLELVRLRPTGRTWTVVYGDGNTEEFTDTAEAYRAAQEPARIDGRAVFVESDPPPLTPN